jgi:hypothetical protein
MRSTAAQAGPSARPIFREHQAPECVMSKNKGGREVRKPKQPKQPKPNPSDNAIIPPTKQARK